jgi:hypothetical protein
MLMFKRILPCLLLCIMLLGIAPSVARAQESWLLIHTNPDIYLSGTVGGTITVTQAKQYPPPPPGPTPDLGYVATTALVSTPAANAFEAVWNIKVTEYTGQVFVKIYTSDSTPVTQMFQTDFVLGDVNHDGKVNLFDLCIIAQSSGSRQGCRGWNPNCDLNCDHKVDVRDLCIAIRNLGKTSIWEDITTELGSDSNGYYVMGVTDHFSLFGVR